MTTLWLPDVRHLPSDHNGGSMTGGPPRWVWHTFECSYDISALQGAQSLIAAGNEVHFTFNPVTGEIVQILPLNVAGRGLVNLSGGVQTNRDGTYCIQVEVIGRASRPFTGDLTAAGRAGLAKLLALADELGIPRVWPDGPPQAYPGDHDPRSSAVWLSHAGHYGHSQVPENTHGDPGAIDIAVLFAALPKTVLEDDMPYSEDQLRDLAAEGVLGAELGHTGVTAGVALDRTVNGVSLLVAQVSALTAAVKALADSQGADGDKIVAAVQASVDKALSGLTIELKTPSA